MTELCGSPPEHTSGSALIRSAPLSSIGLPRFVSGFSSDGPQEEEESDNPARKGSPFEEDYIPVIRARASEHGENDGREISSLVNSKISSNHAYCRICPFIACPSHVVGFHGHNSSDELLSHIKIHHPNEVDELLKCDIEQCNFSHIGFHSFSSSVEHSYNHSLSNNHTFMESEHDGAKLDTYLDITTPADFWKTASHSARMRPKQTASPKPEDDERVCDRCSHQAPLPSPKIEAKQPGLLQDFDRRGSIEYDEQYDDSDMDLENESDSGMGVLEPDMVSIFGRDLGLVARMMPEIHARVLLSGIEESISCAGSESSTSPGVSQSSQGRSSVLANSNLTPSLPRLKRRRDPDQPDDNDQNDGFKKPRPKIIQNRNRRSCFACPFYKRHPQKYRVTTETGAKYRTCIGPGTPELRRLKDHLKNTHKLSQCDKCYNIFDEPLQLIAHRKSAHCQPQPDELKEGIDDDQWPKIEELLKIRRGKIAEDDKSDKEKWFDIWRILYPGIPLPDHPWYDSVQTELSPISRAMEIFVSNMDRITRLKLDNKGLPFNKEYHDLYLLGAQRAFGPGVATKQYIESSSTPQFEEFPSSDTSSCWGTSSNFSQSIHSSNMQISSSDGNFEAFPSSTSYGALVLHGERSMHNQTATQSAFEELDSEIWDHTDRVNLEGRQTTYHDEGISDSTLATTTSPAWEAPPTDTSSQFSLEDYINLDSPLSCRESVPPGMTHAHDEQYPPGGNNQLHRLNFLDDKVEKISLDEAGEPYFSTDGQTGQLESKSYKNRGLRSPVE